MRTGRRGPGADYPEYGVTRHKNYILEACIACVAADGRTTVTEAELLRSVADSLDCPIPPFMPNAE